MKTFIQIVEELREKAYLTNGNRLTVIGEEDHHSNQISSTNRNEKMQSNFFISKKD